MSELLPCPFCGASVSFAPYKRDGLKIECKPCVISYAQRTMRFDLSWLEGKMAEHWNRRPTPSVQTACDRDAERYRYLISCETLPNQLFHANSKDFIDAAIDRAIRALKS